MVETFFSISKLWKLQHRSTDKDDNQILQDSNQVQLKFN